MRKKSHVTFLPKKVQLLFITGSLLLALFLAWYISGQNASHAQAAICSEISYKTVRITAKDTLVIPFASILGIPLVVLKSYRYKNYIKDIKECNSLSSDSINAGCSIIVPVYVQEHSADQN